MSDRKISELTDGGALQDTDLVPVARSGVTYSVAGSQFGFTPVSCVLNNAALINVHAVANYNYPLNLITDNMWDGNILAAPPAGIGVTVVAGLVTITEAGFYCFEHESNFAEGFDSSVVGFIGDTITGVAMGYGPNVPATGYTFLGALPAGASGNFRAETLVASTADPFRIASTVVVTRLG